MPLSNIKYYEVSGNIDIIVGKNSQYNMLKSDETIVATLKQFNNAAPTLPVHSPHSPVHSSTHSSIHQNKLSGRYINNNKVVQQKSSSKLPCAKTSSSKRNCYSHQCNCAKSPKYDETNEKEATLFEFPQNFATTSMANDQLFNSAYSSSKNRKDSNIERQHKPQEYKEKTEMNPKRVVRNTKSNHCPPNRYDNSNLATDLQPQILSRSFDAPFSLTISKSAQTSPNNMDIQKTKFSYDNNKRSTGSLLYVAAVDPWTKKGETLVESFGHADREATDPWIRRSVDSHVTTSRYKDRTYNVKPNRDYSLDTNKKNNYLQPETMSRNRESVLSAPSSPHYLNTSVADNYSMNLSPKRGLHNKSASFSPARGKNSLNPFGDVCENNDIAFSYQSNCTENPEPSIHTENVNSNLLNVKRLHNRHSFSSISKEELQLNIRRLSEQMNQMSLENNIVQLSISDCNVNNRGSYSQAAEYQTQTERDSHLHPKEKYSMSNKDYKEILKPKDNLQTSTHNAKVFTASGKLIIYTSSQKPDSMQETTC